MHHSVRVFGFDYCQHGLRFGKCTLLAVLSSLLRSSGSLFSLPLHGLVSSITTASTGELPRAPSMVD